MVMRTTKTGASRRAPENFSEWKTRGRGWTIVPVAARRLGLLHRWRWRRPSLASYAVGDRGRRKQRMKKKQRQRELRTFFLKLGPDLSNTDLKLLQFLRPGSQTQTKKLPLRGVPAPRRRGETVQHLRGADMACQRSNFRIKSLRVFFVIKCKQRFFIKNTRMETTTFYLQVFPYWYVSSFIDRACNRADNPVNRSESNLKF